MDPTGTILELHPEHGQRRSLIGLYLEENTRAHAVGVEPFVYANFITSMDGRIAVEQPHGDLGVPDQLANPRDWRLFQELAVQSDVMLSSGRYLREYAAGRAQELLRVYDDPGLADLLDWRRSRNLPDYPALAVISASLDFPIPPALISEGRQVVIITTRDAPAERKRALAEAGLTVVEAGDRAVDGQAAVSSLHALGFNAIYSAAGPRVLHLLLTANVLDRLYLTLAARLMGGGQYATIVEGAAFDPPRDLTLQRLYHDPHAPGEGGQFLAVFEVN